MPLALVKGKDSTCLSLIENISSVAAVNKSIRLIFAMGISCADLPSSRQCCSSAAAEARLLFFDGPRRQEAALRHGPFNETARLPYQVLAFGRARIQGFALRSRLRASKGITP
jgi:hypothetical protein